MSKLALIDGDSLAYYSMGYPTLEEGIQNIDNYISIILNACETEKYILFVSNKSYRYQIADARPYKGKRKKSESILLPSLLQYLRQGHGGHGVKLLEADDLVSYFKYKDPENTIVCSPDKDVLYQTAGKHYNYGKREFVTTSVANADHFLWKQTLMGDSTDNIEGIPGIGPKKAEKLLSEGDTSYKNIVLDAYIKHFGIANGIYRFQENFRLVYLLKNTEDMKREIGRDIELPEVREVNFDDMENFM